MEKKEEERQCGRWVKDRFANCFLVGRVIGLKKKEIRGRSQLIKLSNYSRGEDEGFLY